MSPIESQPCKIKTGNDSPNGIKKTQKHPRPMWESCIDSAALSYVSSVLCVSRLISLHFCPNALPRKQRRPVLRSLVSIRIFPVKPWALGVGFRHQCRCGGWCCLAEIGLSQKVWNPATSCCFHEKSLCGIVSANVAGKFLFLSCGYFLLFRICEFV